MEKIDTEDNMKTYRLLTKEYSPEAAIVANGEFPTHPLTVEILKKSRFTVCCDGAVDAYVEAGYIPSAIVGDLDSLSPESRQRFASLLHHDRDQETNDLTKAFRFCLKHNKRDLLIFGATGKREDHTLANISLLADYMDEAQVEMVTDYGVFTPVSGCVEMECFPGQQISLFCMDRCPLTTRHLKYPLHNRIITRWWQATLNEALSSSFLLETTGHVIAFRAFGR